MVWKGVESLNVEGIKKHVRMKRSEDFGKGMNSKEERTQVDVLECIENGVKSKAR